MDMTPAFSLSFAAAMALLCVAALVLQVWRMRALRDAQNFLRLAKQEARDAARIALDNPYPLIQVSDRNDIVFINAAAFEKFPGIREKGAAHPVLSGFLDIAQERKAVSRDIAFGGRVYTQTITPTEANGHAAFTVYCYDVTDRKAYEEQLRESREAAEQARQDAEEANRARGDFLANMSHELRTPMNGIIGLSDILAESGLDPDRQELIEAVSRSARALLVLLNDILDFSKIEAGELTLEAIPFDPRKVVRQVESLQKPVAARKGLEMTSTVDESVPACLVGDPSRLQQILNNLIGNALKFTGEGSVTLSVGGEEDGQGGYVARISVADTGIGIPADKQGALFRKFQQADSSTSRKYGGTGLGLAISKNLAELMGGSIALQSEEGKGTVFTVTVPVRIADAGAMEEERKAGDEQGGIDRAARILVVDDHPVNLLFMRRILGKMGLENFDEASSGQQAVDMARQTRYDLILMDCQMPEMDGYEASRAICGTDGAANSKPVIVAVTANAMKGAEEKCAAAGMDDYISKPVDRNKLRAVLHRWLPGEDGDTGKAGAGDWAAGGTPPEKIPEPEGVCPSPVVFDWDHLSEYTDGDKETETMLIDMFLESLDEDIHRLRDGFSGNDFREWEAAAHKLRGASVHMGAYALADICDRAQSLSEEEVDEMKTLHQSILDESRILQGVLEQSRKTAIRA